MTQAYLSLGSNLGDRLANLHGAIDFIRDFAEIAVVSGAYETEPVEFTEQPWFINAVVAIRLETTKQDAEAAQLVLDRLLAIELRMGRQREPAIPKGPRVIDIDIVLYGDQVIHTPALTIPHPAMHQRRFVLAPLAEIAPNVEHPVLHRSALQLLQALPVDGPQVRRLGSLYSPKES